MHFWDAPGDVQETACACVPRFNLLKTQTKKIAVLKFILFIGIEIIWGTGCAKVGEPQPPEVHIPKPATDLYARQISDYVVLIVSMPVQNTDGSHATNLRSVEVLRLAEDTNDSENTQPLSQEQFIERAAHILSISDSQLLSCQQNNLCVIQDTLPSMDRMAIYDRTFRYAVLFFNKKKQTAGLSNQVSIKLVPIPQPPCGLSSEVAEHSIKLRWMAPPENMDGSRPARIEGYNVFRSEKADKFSSMPINSDPLHNAEYEDRDFLFDKTYYYAVSVIGCLQNPYAESLRSEIHMVAPRDVFPPDPPNAFSAISDNGIVILLWTPPSAQDVAGYRIYRLEEGASAGRMLQNELIRTLSFRDSDASPDSKYEYSITAVDTHGNESSAVRANLETR